VKAAPTPARARAPRLEREIGRVRVYRTSSGLPILVRRKAGAIVHLGVHIVGGASDEPMDYAGLTSIMARTAIKGTARRTASQLAEESETLGGSIAPSAGAESFGWSFSVPARHTDAAMALLAEVVTAASFADEAIATEKTIAIADLALLRDDMYRYPTRLLLRAPVRRSSHRSGAVHHPHRGRPRSHLASTGGSRGRRGDRDRWRCGPR
jgi:zinc protease